MGIQGYRIADCPGLAASGVYRVVTLQWRKQSCHSESAAGQRRIFSICGDSSLGSESVMLLSTRRRMKISDPHPRCFVAETRIGVDGYNRLLSMTTSGATFVPMSHASLSRAPRKIKMFLTVRGELQFPREPRQSRIGRTMSGVVAGSSTSTSTSSVETSGRAVYW